MWDAGGRKMARDWLSLSIALKGARACPSKPVWFDLAATWRCRCVICAVTRKEKCYKRPSHPCLQILPDTITQKQCQPIRLNDVSLQAHLQMPTWLLITFLLKLSYFCGPGMSDISPLSGISGLSFDSTLLSPLLFFCLFLLPFLSYRFLPAGPFF